MPIVSTLAGLIANTESFWHQFIINTPSASLRSGGEARSTELGNRAHSLKRASFRLSASESEKGFFDSEMF
jgi:hypothetical protein